MPLETLGSLDLRLIKIHLFIIGTSLQMYYYIIHSRYSCRYYVTVESNLSKLVKYVNTDTKMLQI